MLPHADVSLNQLQQAELVLFFMKSGQSFFAFQELKNHVSFPRACLFS